MYITLFMIFTVFHPPPLTLPVNCSFQCLLCTTVNAVVDSRLCKGKGKGKGKRSIAVRKKPHRYGNSRAIWDPDHTVLGLPATRQR